MTEQNYIYECVKCKQKINTWASPKDYRLATGKMVSCCGEVMQLKSKQGVDSK